MERKIKLFTLRVWPDGIHEDELAGHLEHIANMLREGYQSGEVCPNEGGGWWNTLEEEDEPSVAMISTRRNNEQTTIRCGRQRALSRGV